MHQLALFAPSKTVALHAVVPSLVAGATEQATRRFLEFFAVTLRNTNTRMPHYRAVVRFFAWCDRHRLGEVGAIKPLQVVPILRLCSGSSRTHGANNTWPLAAPARFPRTP
jgi:hypothetical protein